MYLLESYNFNSFANQFNLTLFHSTNYKFRMMSILLIIFFATIFTETVPIRFIIEPRDVHVYNSNDTKFTCLAESEFSITYVWLKNGKTSANNRWQAYGATLYYHTVKEKDNGVVVTCQATDSTGIEIQASAIIHVYNRSTATYPLITTGPNDVEAESGANVNFNCTAYGVMGDIRWIHRDLELGTIPDLRDVTTYNDGLNITSTLSLIEVYAENNGVYVCEAFGTPLYVDGFDSRNATLIVRQSPHILSIPLPVFATEGEEMNATCVFSGYPEPTVIWVDENDTIVNTGSSWIVNNVTTDIEGVYSCIGRNTQGTAYSGIIYITVYSIPWIISEFEELLDVSLGDELQLECTAIGRPLPDVLWYKDDYQLISSNRITIETNHLLINAVDRPDQGSYYCTAVNTVGNVSSEQTFVKVHSIPLPPSGLEIVEITHNSAKLHWISIVSTDPVFQFDVIVMDTNFSFLLPNSSIPIDSLSTVNGLREYTIQGLSAYTYYLIWIQAINDIGASEFSQFELFQTKTWFPSPPIIHTRNITPFSVDIQIISDESALNGPYEGVNLTITSQREGLLTDTRVFNSSSQLIISISLYDLLPYNKYTLTTHTFNGDYYSEPSTAVFLTLESHPSSPPSNLQASCASPTICLLNWEPPKEPNGLITSYTLSIENLGVTESHIISFTVTNDTSFYIADNLTPYSSYSWRIFASTQAGAGPQVTGRFKTPQGVPSDSPALTVETVNSTAMRLTWLRLDSNTLNGEFHHYQILYTYTDINGENVNRTLIIPLNRDVTISNLTPYTNYGFSIRVNAGIGYGPYSINPIHKITFSEIPDSVVDNFTAISFTPNSVFLEWREIPKNLIYASTANYRIQIKSQDNWLKLDEVTYTTNRYYVNYLQPNTLYLFRMQLFNFLGFAPYSKQINVTTQQTIPLVPVVIGSLGATSLKILLEITPQNSTTGDITEYEVKVNEIGKRVIDIKTILPLNIHDTTHFRYNATKYFTFYKFTISAKTSVGFGEPAIYLIETGQAAPSTPPQSLIALPQTSTSVYLSWEPISNRNLNGQLTGYLIRYSTVLHQDWVYLNYTQSAYKLVIDLDKYTVYTFQVAGVTIAISEYSNLASNRTLPDSPGEINSVSLVNAEANILRIRWNPPSEPNGIISQYRIKVQNNINDLAIHASTLNSIILRDLYPYTLYTIQVAATNQVNTGPYSDEFIFSTTEDTPSKPVISQVYRQGYQLTVSWYTPYDPNGLIIEYNLTCFLLSASDTPTYTYQITVLHEPGIFSYSASCTQLTPNSVYLIQLSARNSYNTSWTSIIKNTDYLPPKIVDDSSTKPEKINERMFALPKYSKTVGKISFYLIVVLVYDPLITTIDMLTTNQSIYSLLAYAITSDSAKPQNYIAANFTSTEYGVFNLGDNEVYGDYRNIPLIEGYGYTFYVKACVNSINQNRFLATSSSLSEPIIIAKEIPANDQIAAISAVVAVSTIFLCLLICIFVILISAFCARIRSKRKSINSSNNLISKQHIPYQPCDTEYNTVPWIANVNFKKSFKGIDPISKYRSTANDPQLDARAPVPAFMLPKILEDLTADDDLRLSEEYSYLVPIDTSTTIVANAEINVKKNRYLNILPYDHNRVCLQVNSKTDSDYINASFIDSADKINAYIATQGPTESTLEDFWHMAYEQHVQSLVMVTKLKEKGVDKCIQYWPTKDTNIFGKYKVTLLSTSVYCDYIVRKLLLGKIATNKDSRVIYHFQFISWPDHGVPPHPLPMLNFLKRVHQTMNRKLVVTQHPILVHCSAGVGRTGTFIVLDSMLKRMMSDKDVDVFGHVAYLRTQRMFMVQGEDQYLFIYKVLAECYTSYKTNIPLKIIDSVYSNLAVVDPNTQKSGFEFEFNLLEGNYEESDFSSAENEVNKQKNRYTQIKPYEDSRVTLPIINEQQDTDYINASIIDGFIYKQQFIATQTPLANTIPDFWRMIWQRKSPIIVMITTQSSDFDECYFPEKLQIYDKFQVEKISDRSNKDNYIYQQFSVMNISTGEARTISHFQYSPFSQLNKSFSAKALLLLCQEIANMFQSISSGPITVHCNNGSGNTGMLIAVMNLLEELKEAMNINISQTVHYLRSQRPFMVQTVEQYQIIYEAILQQALHNSTDNISRRASGIEECTPPTSPVKMSTFSKTRDSLNSLSNRFSYTNNYRNSLASNSSAFSNHDEVLETST